jgi:hypothetical protein
MQGSNFVTHGLSHLPEYSIWKGVKARCFNPKSKIFSYYGGRGITMVEPWRSNFASFLKDAGLRPSPRHQLDRIDNNRNYEPGNVRWVTRTQQCNNRRNNRFYTWNGQTKTLSQWARHLGFERLVLHNRLLRYGWTVERAFTQRKRIHIY